MSLLRRTAVRRLLIGFLLVAALATGLWWNSNRPLNATEQNLVGVWETVDPAQTGTAIARLADRMSLSLYHQGEPGDWTWMPPHYEWVASARSFHARPPLAMPMPLSLDAWQYYAWRDFGVTMAAALVRS